MNHREYRLLNAVVMILLFIIFVFSITTTKDSKFIPCQVLTNTGKTCNSCGLTRDFIAYSHLDFSDPINENSKFVYIWFLFQFILRSIITLKPSYIGARLMKVDLVLTILSGTLAFIPLWI